MALAGPLFVGKGSYAIERATVRQKKTGRPVRFELTEQTRQASKLRGCDVVAVRVDDVAPNEPLGQEARILSCRHALTGPSAARTSLDDADALHGLGPPASRRKSLQVRLAGAAGGPMSGRRQDCIWAPGHCIGFKSQIAAHLFGTWTGSPAC